jgi:hypothetical protein
MRSTSSSRHRIWPAFCGDWDGGSKIAKITIEVSGDEYRRLLAIAKRRRLSIAHTLRLIVLAGLGRKSK